MRLSSRKQLIGKKSFVFYGSFEVVYQKAFTGSSLCFWRVGIITIVEQSGYEWHVHGFSWYYLCLFHMDRYALTDDFSTTVERLFLENVIIDGGNVLIELILAVS